MENINLKNYQENHVEMKPCEVLEIPGFDKSFAPNVEGAKKAFGRYFVEAVDGGIKLKPGTNVGVIFVEEFGYYDSHCGYTRRYILKVGAETIVVSHSVHHYYAGSGLSGKLCKYELVEFERLQIAACKNCGACK